MTVLNDFDKVVLPVDNKLKAFIVTLRGYKKWVVPTETV